MHDDEPSKSSGRWSSSFPPSLCRYDADEYDWPRAVARLLGTEALETLGGGRDYARFTRATDQSTTFHRRFYDSFRELRPLYRRFVEDVASRVIGEPFCFQRVPSFRVHLPGNVAVGEFHTDAKYNHGPGEIDFWVPLTSAQDSNTIWIERRLGAADCAPVPPMAPGDMLVFDAVRWRHGNVVNESGSARVSFDFRCIPLSEYRPSDRRTVNTGQRLVIGDYFEVLAESRTGHASEPVDGRTAPR